MSVALVIDNARPIKAHTWARDPNDWYVDPADCTEALLTVESFGRRVWDPCCGQGNIVRTLRAAGHEAVGSDLVRRVEPGTPWFLGELNFLETLFKRPAAKDLVFNPPFFRAFGTEMFVRKALNIPGVRKLAVFAPYDFLAGDSRWDQLLEQYPLSRTWILTPRPSCPPGAYLLAGKKAGGGRQNWCWLIWDSSAPPSPHVQLGRVRRPVK